MWFLLWCRKNVTSTKMPVDLIEKGGLIVPDKLRNYHLTPLSKNHLFCNLHRMKQQGEQTKKERTWDSIKIRMDYGYFASYPDASITCYSDGMLEFKTESGIPFLSDKRVEDRNHEIRKKSLEKLDQAVQKLNALEKLEMEGYMCDGPSFECMIYLSNGMIRGFHYCSVMLSEEIQELEGQLRKLLREDFFLRKHKSSRQ